MSIVPEDFEHSIQGASAFNAWSPEERPSCMKVAQSLPYPQPVVHQNDHQRYIRHSAVLMNDDCWLKRIQFAAQTLSK